MFDQNNLATTFSRTLMKQSQIHIKIPSFSSYYINAKGICVPISFDLIFFSVQ